MRERLRCPFVFLMLLVTSCVLTTEAQELPRRDTSIVFEPSQQLLQEKSSFQRPYRSFGFDLMLSDNGLGVGGFYREELSDEFSWFISLAISDVKDEEEVERFDPFGRSYVPYKKNRLLFFPLFAGVQYRMFKDQIMDNFRPYLSAGIGPSMMFVAPYQNIYVYSAPGAPTLTTYERIDFFDSLKYGQAKFTVGGYIGFGAFFGLTKGSLSGLSVRYYYAPFPSGIETLQNSYLTAFQGLFITINFGSLY